MFSEITKQIEESTQAIQDLQKIICLSDKRKVQYYARDLMEEHREKLKLSLKKLQVLS